MISQITAKQTDCPIYEQKFKKTYRLREHMNQHMVDPKFVCPECNKGFGEKARLQQASSSTQTTE